jgi:hypothetical protein
MSRRDFIALVVLLHRHGASDAAISHHADLAERGPPIRGHEIGKYRRLGFDGR